MNDSFTPIDEETSKRIAAGMSGDVQIPNIAAIAAAKAAAKQASLGLADGLRKIADMIEAGQIPGTIGALVVTDASGNLNAMGIGAVDRLQQSGMFAAAAHISVFSQTAGPQK